MWLLSDGDLFANRFRILREIGAGGMSHVYAVHDEELDYEVALKVIKPDIAQDENFVERFKREVRIARQIRHPNIVQVLDFGSTEIEGKRLYFLTMELLQGRDLREWLDEARQLTLVDTVRVGLQVCDALAEAHRGGVTHRDIKPQNIFIDTTGKVKLMDFGVSRLSSLPSVTTMGQLIGTPKYMSPEQVHRKEEVDRRSDIYSTGVLLFELATGRPPFDGESMIPIALKHVDEEPPTPSEYNNNLPEEFDDIVLTCLRKSPAERYQTADELRTKLQSVPTDVPATSLDTQVLTMSTTARERFVAPTDIGTKPQPPRVAPRHTPTPPPPAPPRRASSGATLRSASRRSAPPQPRPLWRHPAVVTTGSLVVAGLIAAYFLVPPSESPPLVEPGPTVTIPEIADEPAVDPSAATATDSTNSTASLMPLAPEELEARKPEPGASASQRGSTQGVTQQTGQQNRPEATPRTSGARSNVAPAGSQPSTSDVATAPARTELSINSNPSGADVAVDGRKVGTTPWRGPVDPGRRRVTVSKQGFATALETVDVRAGATGTRRVELSPVNTEVALSFSSNPGTEIYVDGARMGSIPPKLELKLTTGEHTVRYLMPDYAEHQETIRVTADGPNEFSHRFPLPGPIRITAQPYARVFLDGEDLGYTPVSAERVAEGTHSLRLVREGFRTIEQTITVKALEVNRFTFTLEANQ